MQFNFYGLLLEIKFDGFDKAYFNNLSDFDYFRIETKSNNPDFLLSLSKCCVQDLKKNGFFIFKTRMCEARQISLSERQLTYILNSNTVAQVKDVFLKNVRAITLYGENFKILNEILYFIIVSVVGEYFDKTGLMRVHAASFLKEKKSFILWGGQGAGKSTFSKNIVDLKYCKIFSDELTLFDLNKKILLTFPVRNRLNAIKKNDFNYFFDQKKKLPWKSEDIALEKGTPVKILFLFSKNENQTIRPSFLFKIKLFASILFGIGLIQMIEYFIRPNNILTLFLILKNRFRLIFELNKISKLILFRSDDDIKSFHFIKENLFDN